MNFKQNEIKIIYPGAFKNLTRLEEIELSWNSIQEINSNMFSGSFDYLIEINLSRNNISRFSIDSKNLKRLERIDLSGNKVNEIHYKAFDGLINLEKVDLAYN